MSDFSTPLGWGDVFSVLSGAPGGERIVGEIMGTDPSNVQANRTFGGQVNDPMAQQRQQEISRLQSIGRGQIDDQSVTGMQQALARGGKQAYGLGQASPFSSAGARGRMARGGQLAISREAPQLVQAQRLQSQQSAREMAADQLAQAQAIEQQRLEAIQDDVVDAQVRREKAIQAKRQASSSGISGALMTAFGLFKEGGVVPGHKDQAVPIIAHGGEVVLPEDVSKKLLKALADKDKGNVPTYEWTSGWEGPPAPEQIVAPRWAIKDIDPRFEIPEKNYPAYADAVIDERRIRYPGMTVGIRGPRSNEDGWMELAAIRREHTAGSPWYRGAPRYPSRYDVPGGKTRTGQSSQMTESQVEEIMKTKALSDLDKRIDDLERDK